MPQGRKAAHFLLSEEVGRRESLLGNEAIVRGALEAGVAFVSGYPGTPSSEVTDSFALVSPEHGIVFEYSVNEKIALEMAFAASLAGARALCAMKHLGLMVAGDPLSTIPYVGVGGGLVIVSAGDPSCRTSPNEQDQRYLGPMLHLVVLDPSTPQEAHAMTRAAFALSEESQLPVMLRATTRVCHSRATVTFGPMGNIDVAGFARDPARLIPVPVNARRMRLELPGRLERARAILGSPAFVRVEGTGPHAVLATGAPAAMTADLLVEHGLVESVTLLTVGAVHPLPHEQILEALATKRRVLVVEELSPFLEDTLRALVSQRRLDLEVLGKRTGHLPEPFEYEPPVVRKALKEVFGLGDGQKESAPAVSVPSRPPTLCPGCPHRAGFFAARAAFPPDQLFFSDIGCYTLGIMEPLGVGDALLCMGAGFTLAAGVSRVTGQRTVGVMGDSTFFHSGMPALLNVIKEDVGMVAVILDNQVTAMTGFQESPTVSLSGEAVWRAASLVDVVRALGARHVERVDPYDLSSTIQAFVRAREASGLSVVILERPCPAFLSKRLHTPYKVGTFAVDSNRCQVCHRESAGMRCSGERTLESQRQGSRQRCLWPRKVSGAAHKTAGPGAVGLESAPCSVACPLGLCVQGLLGHVSAGELAHAYQMIMDRISLPDSVCRVCHRPCEAACALGPEGAPVAVNAVKRFVMDRAAEENMAYEPKRDPPSGHRVAVVGAGPAGLAAAHDLALCGHEVTLLDRAAAPGGLLRWGIPAYRLPPSVVERDVERILGIGVEFRSGVTLGVDFTLSSLLAEGFDAICLATGAQEGIPLNLAQGLRAGEDLGVDVDVDVDADVGAGAGAGTGRVRARREISRSMIAAEAPGPPHVLDALRYLKDTALGRLSSAPRQVLVLGGGNAAVDAARTARRLGAGEVTILYRRQRADMPALAQEVAAALEEGVVLLEGRLPRALVDGGLECLRTEPGPVDSSGRPSSVPVQGSEHILAADLILVAIGQRPRLPEDPGLDPPLALDGAGLVLSDPETGRTSHPRIFAGGDLVPGQRTVTSAMSAGQRAAWGIDVSLRGPAEANRRPPPPRTDLRARHGISRSMIAAEAPGGQGARRANTVAYSTDDQRSPPGWIGGEGELIISRRALRAANGASCGKVLSDPYSPGPPRQHPSERSLLERMDGFLEVEGAFTEEEARDEASRCRVCGLCGHCRACLDLLGCPAFYVANGQVQIDASLCMGCGICAAICPNQAIYPVEDRGLEDRGLPKGDGTKAGPLDLLGPQEPSARGGGQ